MEENEVCVRCGKSSEQVKLVDAIHSQELVKICEECAMTDDSPLIRRPSSEQLKNSEKPYSVRQRLSKISGVPTNFKPEVQVKDYSKEIRLDNLRKPKDYKSILNAKFDAAKKRNQPLNLIDNFNWHILMARKNKKISRKQLADTIGESETTLKMIEENFLPDDALRAINKIEQYFGINLRKDSVRVDNNYMEKPAVVLKFDPSAAKTITIDDLRRMKAEKEKAESTGQDMVVDFSPEKQEIKEESGLKKVGSFFKNFFKSEKKEEQESKEESQNQSENK